MSALLEADFIDPPAPELSGHEAAIAEAAFQIYWRFARTNEASARTRFAKLRKERREEWEGDAKAAFRVFEVHSEGVAE